MAKEEPICPAERHVCVPEHQPTLIQRAERMTSVTELLLETLSDLSDTEIKDFKQDLLLQIDHYRPHSNITWRMLMMTDMQDTVFLTVQMFGQQSVERTREIFGMMKRPDLVQRLSDSNSGSKKKDSVDENLSALIYKVATMAAVKELLLETLKDLSDEDLEKFKWFLQLTCFHKGYPYIPWRELERAAKVKIVDLMVDMCGQKSVEVTMEIFVDMDRTDLVHRLSETSSGPKASGSAAEASGVNTTEGAKVEHRFALIQKEEMMASVIDLLLETLADLSDEKMRDFKLLLLSKIHGHRFYSDIQWRMLAMDTQDTVLLMVQTYGQQSVQKSERVLWGMQRTDLAQRLCDSSSGAKHKLSEDERRSPLVQKVITVAAVKELLLETLNKFSYQECRKFKEFLQLIVSKRDFLETSRMLGEEADREVVVNQMMENYGQKSVDVIREISEDMNRTDLVERWSETRPRSKVLPLPSQSLLHSESGTSTYGCHKAGIDRDAESAQRLKFAQQESSTWTKLEPEVNSTDADETYSLQSEAGTFECNVSGLRWVCEEKVRIKYQFCSWEGHMERMESRGYMPAGPLMDITVDAGKLGEVYLPHWVCIDDNPTISDEFAVLHIDNCGDVVEKACEVKPSHVKLSKPVFSPRAVLMKAGLPVKVNCNVLLYKTNTAFLTLHVYLIPRDPALQKAMDQRESSYGYKIIRKPHPEKSLKMRDRFILTADLEKVEIYPENLKLRYESREPNFFEMFNENPGRNFKLSLTQEDEAQPVWTCVIRKDEYQSSGHTQGKHFVDEHQCDLIDRVSNIGSILDTLLSKGVIQQEEYNNIRASPTTQEKMRKLYLGALRAGGQESKDTFYKTLEAKEPCLVADLKRKQS